MAATYVSGSVTSTDVAGGADPWSIAGPAGATAGDIVVVGIEIPFAAGAPDSVPAGFTAGPVPVEGPTDGRGRFYHGLFDTVGAGPYSWGWPASVAGCAITLAVRGADQVTPLHVATVSSDHPGASTTTWTGPGQTSTISDVCFVGFGGCSPDGVGRTWAITGDFTERLFFQVTSHQLIVGTIDQGAPATKTVSGTVTVADKTYTCQYCFAPVSEPQTQGWPASESLGFPAKQRSALPMITGPREDRIMALQSRRPGA